MMRVRMLGVMGEGERSLENQHWWRAYYLLSEADVVSVQGCEEQ